MTGQMGTDGTPDAVARQLAAVVARVEAVEAENLKLAQENQRLDGEIRALRGSGSAGDESATHGSITDESDDHVPGPLTRRGLLLGGAGIVAGTVALAASATPAAATDGSAILQGQANSGTLPTSITNTDSGGVALSAISGAIGIYAHRTGQTSSIGASQDAGVVGDSTTGIGVFGATTSGTAVKGQASSASSIPPEAWGGGPTGIWGDSQSSNGVVGTSDGGTGVLGFARNGIAVFGLENGSAGGTALWGESALGLAAYALSNARQLRLSPGDPSRVAPGGDAISHNAGELFVDGSGDLWYCSTAGTPGSWRKVGGAATAGAFHVLPTPVRIYDSRPGTSPSVGPKSPLVANTARTLDLTVNSSHVPPGASAAMVNLLVVNAAAGNANFTIWANGASRPSANAMVWGGTVGRFSSLALTAIDATAKCQVLCSVQTDIVIDVVGYYQ